MFHLQRKLALVAAALVLSLEEDGSLGSESSGSGCSDDSSGSSDELSSFSCVYSSIESSSPDYRDRRRARRYYGRRGGYGDYRDIPPRGRY